MPVGPYVGINGHIVSVDLLRDGGAHPWIAESIGLSPEEFDRLYESWAAGVGLMYGAPAEGEATKRTQSSGAS